VDLTVVYISRKRLPMPRRPFLGQLSPQLALQVSWVGVRCLAYSTIINMANLMGTYLHLAINMSLAFCMGTDIDGLVDSPIGQPMAQIFFNSFGQNATLALWSFVVLVQYVTLNFPGSVV
jgi:hypothetical protein